MRLPLIAVALSVLGVSACTWVPMAPEATAVHVVSAGAAPAGCDKRGDINVSVKHSVAFYERNALRVRDELETLARNEAAASPANTVQPLGDPADGAQRFAAYQCSRRERLSRDALGKGLQSGMVCKQCPARAEVPPKMPRAR